MQALPLYTAAMGLKSSNGQCDKLPTLQELTHLHPIHEWPGIGFNSLPGRVLSVVLEVFCDQKPFSFPCVHSQRKERPRRSATVVTLTLQRIRRGIYAAGGEGGRQVAGVAKEVADQEGEDQINLLFAVIFGFPQDGSGRSGQLVELMGTIPGPVAHL